MWTISASASAGNILLGKSLKRCWRSSSGLRGEVGRLQTVQDAKISGLGSVGMRLCPPARAAVTGRWTLTDTKLRYRLVKLEDLKILKLSKEETEEHNEDF